MKTKQKLVQVSGRLFAQHGYDGVSIRDIAKAAGVNLGAVTYHFGSKESLFGEVLLTKITPFNAIAEEVEASRETPERKLYLLLERYAMRLLHTDPSVKVFFAEALAGGARLPDGALAAVDKRNRVFRDIVEQGISDGRFRPCDSETAAWIFFGMLSSYALYRPLMPDGRRGTAFSASRVRHIVKVAMDAFLVGLKVGPDATQGDKTEREVE